MAMNRIQFQPGLSMAQFMALYGREEQCEAALFRARWPQGFRCPKCCCDLHTRFVREGRQYYQCRRCRHQSTLRAGTVFAATKLSLTRWFLAMHLLTQAKNNVCALELSRHLGVCYRSAWLIKHKLMQVMAEREAGRMLEGRVEVDDAYLGGEASEGTGRGAAKKVPFIAAVQTSEDGRPQFVALARVSGFTREAVEAWAQRTLSPRTRALSDGLKCFGALAGLIDAHEPHVVGSGKQAVSHGAFRWVNTVLSNLKTAMSGTYHAFGFDKYAARYLAEMQYRFNRRFDLSSILVRLLHAAAATVPWPEPVIRLAEVHR
jgi:hypothetical protein